MKNSSMESTKGKSTIELLATDFAKDIEIIMTRCYFIQPIKSMPKGGKKFIHTKMFFATSTEIKHLNFNIKEGIDHLILFLSFQYCYATKICNDFSMKVRGKINK